MNPIHKRNPIDITEPAHTSSDPISPLLSKPDHVISTIPSAVARDPVIDPILLATEPVTPTDSDLSPVPSPPVIDPILLATEPVINTPEVPPASFIPQVKNPLRLNSRVAGVSGTFRQTPSSSSTPSIPATPIPIPAIPSIPATSPTLPIIPVTAEAPVPPTTNAKSKPKPRPVKSKTPAVPKAPNAPNKAKAMRIQKTINARNLCAAAWKASGNLLGTAKQFKGYWEQLPAAEKAVFEAQAQRLLASTSTLASVATTGSEPRGNTEEEFAGSDGDK
ncbi:hypothetical protein EDD22DRAFT_846739 [Suillus occidentalis]|nr:hypothetical protein EDD22DRAFT_846739 [Suillus occidentalis]